MSSWFPPISQYLIIPCQARSMVLINVGEILVKHSCLSCHLISIENILSRMLDIFPQNLPNIRVLHLTAKPCNAVIHEPSCCIFTVTDGKTKNTQMHNSSHKFHRVSSCLLLTQIVYILLYCN